MNSPVRPVLLAVALGGTGVFTGIWTVLWALRGSYLTALIMLAVTIWAIGFAVFCLCTALGVVTPRAHSDPNGILLRPGVILDLAAIASTAAITLAAALYLIFSRLGMVDYVPSAVPRAALPAACIGLMIFGVPALYQMARQKCGHHLRLDPAGFEVWNGHWNSLRRGSWDDVEQILDHPPKGGRPFNKLVVFLPSTGSAARLYADAVAEDGDALRDWVRFYWKNPEHRAELVDDRALRRLEQRQFTTG